MYLSAAANDTEQKILDFAKLKEGWHLGEGDQIDAAGMCEACSLNSLLLMSGFPETDAFPGFSGEVQVTAYWEKDYFEFTRERNGEWSFIHEHSNDIIDEIPSLTYKEIENIVCGLYQRIWSTSDLYHDNTGISDSSDLRALLSSRQVTGEYPSSSMIAYVPVHGQYVTISAPSIQVQESLPFSGRLSTQYSQTPLRSLRPRPIQEMCATRR